MDVRRWEEEEVEELTPAIGRQALHTDRLTVARILLRAGAVVPAHAHDHEQVSTVLRGRLRFQVGGDERVIAANESVIVPANVPHGVEAIENTVVLDVFAPARDDWVRGDDAYLRSPRDG
jgi:quercetin dioxygenase-like cupin family protein